MKRLTTFLLIFLLGIGSKLRAMDGPISDPEVFSPKKEPPSDYRNEEYYEENLEKSSPNEPFRSSSPSSPRPSDIYISGGSNDQAQPSWLEPVSYDERSSSNINAVYGSSPLTKDQADRGLSVDDLNMVQINLEEARQAAAQRQIEYENMLLQMEQERQAEENGPIQLTPEQQKWRPKIKQTQRSLRESQKKINAQKETSSQLESQIKEAKAELAQIQQKLREQRGNTSEATAQLRRQVNELEAKKGRLQVRAKRIKQIEAEVTKAQNAYDNILKQAGIQKKEELEAERQEKLAQTAKEVASLQQVVDEKQKVYDNLLSQARDQAARIAVEREALREKLARVALDKALKYNALREQRENALLEQEYQTKIKDANQALEEAKKAAQNASNQRIKQEEERIAAQQQAELEQLRADWQEAQRRMQNRKATRAQNLAKQWIENVREQVAQSKAQEALREQLAKEAFDAAVQSNALREQRENALLEQEYQAKINEANQALEEARKADQDAHNQRIKQEEERIAAQQQAELEQLRIAQQKAEEQERAEQERLSAEQARLDALTEVTESEEIKTIAEPPVILAPIVSLPEPIQKEAEVQSLVSAADTQRTVVQSYVKIQAAFVQQISLTQITMANATGGGQATPAQVAQLSASVQTLSSQAQQINSEQQQAKKDIVTLQALNEEIIKKLDTQIAQSTSDKQGNEAENIAQIQAYQQQLAVEQQQLAAYLKTFEGQSARNKEVIEFYKNELEKIKEEQANDASVEKDIETIPSEIQEGQEADQGYETESEEDYQDEDEDEAEALEDKDEAKNCSKNIEKIMNLELELKSIFNEIKELEEDLAQDSEQLDTEIIDAVEKILGKRLNETPYDSDDMFELVEIGKEHAFNGHVLTVLEQRDAASPFNRNGVYLARLNKELSIIQGEIEELEEDHPQTSDKPICQTLARMLNQIAKQVKDAKKTLEDLTKRNDLNLLLVQST